MTEANTTLTRVEGLQVGHWTDLEAATGCTVVLCDGARCAVEVRGAGPATRETDVLRPGNRVESIQAVLLTGGSAFGLGAADGVMSFLEQQSKGFMTSSGPVPIVPCAGLYDLGLVRRAWPGPDDGRAACAAASSAPVAEGCVGAGTGCSVGKVLGLERATKAGLGSTALVQPDGLIVAALVAANAVGNVVDPQTGRILAGVRDPRGSGFLDAEELMAAGDQKPRLGENTTLAMVATNADLDRAQLKWLAQVAHNGIARAVRPAHTLYDGDTVFALSLPRRAKSPIEVHRVGTLAVRAVERAVMRAVFTATRLAGLPSAGELAEPE